MALVNLASYYRYNDIIWDRDVIVIMKDVRVSPPYSPDCCTGSSQLTNMIKKQVFNLKLLVPTVISCTLQNSIVRLMWRFYIGSSTGPFPAFQCCTLKSKLGMEHNNSEMNSIYLEIFFSCKVTKFNEANSKAGTTEDPA